jgi:arginyl-tRNA synthetase
MQDKIKSLISEALKNLQIEEVNFSVEHPEDLKNGDYSTNVAMIVAKNIKKNPKELAEKIAMTIQKAQGKFPEIQKIQVAGAGFINFYLSQNFFVNSIKEILASLMENKNFGQNNLFKEQKIMVEYTQPNPFKPFHIGHLMSNAIGESISRIMEFSGAKIVRANYQGDVGPHVAKAIYAILKFGMPEENKSIPEKARYIGELYAKGNDAYERDENAKNEIEEINKKIYDQSDEEINKIYDWGKRITLEAFEEIYKILGTSFNYYFFESLVAPIGQKIVLENPSLFEKSDGAIVFHAEKFDPKLHTRVFINSKGLPTYETKELGLNTMKFEKEKLDMSVVVTAHEQAEYMKVVKKALEMLRPEYASKIKHVVHGMMRLASGKMSSRKGNVITGESLIIESCDKILEKIQDRSFTDEEKKLISSEVGVGALKYSILKQDIGGDIVYDAEKSISFEGDSGPYLQYSYARANSILENAKKENVLPGFPNVNLNVFLMEKMLYRFPEVVLRSALEIEPHHIANYLVEIARMYNAFYGNTKIIDKDNESSSYNVALTLAFSIVMKNGLNLLGIKAPERM